ncbi:MAG: YwiC-like family protein [Acidobacteria bacterium]|nr:YwiC-like family protein [Acidobacteriota bacterium]
MTGNTVRATSAAKGPSIKLRRIALPTEHGSWGILLEPLIGGIVVAFSTAAPFVALFFVGAFLMRQPLKIFLADTKAGRKREQTNIALKFVLGYGVVFFIGLVGMLMTARLYSLVPLLLVAPLAAVQIGYDAAGKSRRVLPELLGAIALSSSASVTALAAGWSYLAAGALSAIFVLRLIPSMLYVRERLLLEKGKKYSYLLPSAAHVAGLAGIVALILYGLAPRLTLPVFVVLLTRELSGLSRFRQKLRATQIGVLEVIYGVLVVLSVVVGHYTNL